MRRRFEPEPAEATEKELERNGGILWPRRGAKIAKRRTYDVSTLRSLRSLWFNSFWLGRPKCEMLPPVMAWKGNRHPGKHSARSDNCRAEGLTETPFPPPLRLAAQIPQRQLRLACVHCHWNERPNLRGLRSPNACPGTTRTDHGQSNCREENRSCRFQ